MLGRDALGTGDVGNPHGRRADVLLRLSCTPSVHYRQAMTGDIPRAIVADVGGGTLADLLHSQCLRLHPETAKGPLYTRRLHR